VSAFAKRRAGWTALVVTVIGAGIFGYGWVNAPPPMTLAEVPHAIIRVLARVIP
jgi:hypothetical protein